MILKHNECHYMLYVVILKHDNLLQLYEKIIYGRFEKNDVILKHDKIHCIILLIS